MKCPNCNSEMFITDESTSSRSHVTFYRCSLCVSEHVSSEPVYDATEPEQISYFDTVEKEQRRYLML